MRFYRRDKKPQEFPAGGRLLERGAKVVDTRASNETSAGLLELGRPHIALLSKALWRDFSRER